ncbi:MAG: hypothetical protein J0M08_07580 [Bacteroidetes bacterium]|nr:hypothetical protein [Bacteroidota bacterium]
MATKTTSKCPKCVGAQITGKSWDRFLGESAAPLEIETFMEHTYPLVPKICTKCGYVEFYALFPKRKK